MGSLYRPKLKTGSHSSIFWVKYYINGKPVRESTGTDKETEARRFLKEREGRVATGQPVLPKADRVRYEEAADDLRAHYKTTGSRNITEAEWRLKHLGRYFGGRRIAGIGQADATAYALARQAAEASNATINRELAVLIRMLRLAYENGKLLRMPIIRKLKEGGPRQGFFEKEQYMAVRRHLRPDLQLAIDIEYTYGWRNKSEVLSLERRHIDLREGTLRLEPGTTKNDDGRLVYLTAELKAQIIAQLDRVRDLEKKANKIIPYLFVHLQGPHRGRRIRDFRKTWATACRRAGVAGRLRHDFRRTAVRNMVNKGIAERVAMKVTGHKTRAVFDRYHIVSPGDLQDVADKLSGTFSGTSGRRSVDAVSAST